MASITKGWSTSFIFKQDLTSYYMNSLLRSVIRPGIYNANMALGYGIPTVGSGMGTGGSLCLFIKEGTTFVFSNDYVYDESLGYRRNFCDFSSKVGEISDNENSCIIKSVTLSDISVGLGNGYDPGLYSIHAYIRYNPLDANNLDTSSPTFILVKEESESEEPRSNYLYGNQSQRYPSNSEAGASPLDNGSHAIFDGAKTSDANAEWPLSYYLNLGFVFLDKKTEDNKTLDVVTMFTGRGLPEYRYSQSMDSSIMAPDMIPDVSGNMKGLYFDIPKTLIGTTLIEQRMYPENPKNPSPLNGNFNWEAAYFGSRRPNSVTVPVTFSGNNGGTYAVYGLVSNIRSFGTVQGNIPSIKDSSIIFDKLKLSNSCLSINKGDSWIKDSNSVPLDISVLNVEGLLNNSIIKGKDIWSYVIDNIRKNGNPSNVTDVVPVGIVSVDKDGEVIPELSFSYFGLQSRLPRVNVLNIREHNIFNVIPVME